MKTDISRARIELSGNSGQPPLFSSARSLLPRACAPSRSRRGTGSIFPVVTMAAERIARAVFSGQGGER